MTAPTLTASGAPIYGRLPRALLRDPNISRDARLLWILLEDHCSKENDVPWPSQETMAGLLGCTTRAVRNWLNELARAGWLKIEHVPGGSNRHHLVWVPRNEGSGGGRNPRSGGVGTHVPTKKNQEEEPLEEETPPYPPDGGADTGADASHVVPLFDTNTEARKERVTAHRSKAAALEASFGPWWENYPSGKSRGARAQALRAWGKVVGKGQDRNREPVTTTDLHRRLDNYRTARAAYAEWWEDRGVSGTAPLMNGATFINSKSSMFDEPWTVEDLRYWPAPQGRYWDESTGGGENLQDVLQAEIEAERAARNQTTKEAAS